jgi:flagellar basal-body rod protein FlgC
MVFDPQHPDADEEGMVAYPNINTAVEMVNLISAQRAYEANIAVITSGRQMKQRALDILQQ